MNSLFLTLVALFLVLLNGFFVAAEFALVKLRRSRAEELAKTTGLRGRVLRTVRARLDTYLSACQLGITLASLALGWIGEPAVASILRPVLEYFGVGSPELVHSIAFVVAFGLISYLHIVLGELAPKSFAIRSPEVVSLWTALPLYVFYWLMYPFIWVLNASANGLLRLLGIGGSADEDDAPHSADEIKTVLMASHRHGELDAHETALMAKALAFSELTIEEVMRPASDLIYLDITDGIAENITRALRYRYSRYPVCEGDRDHMLGLLLIKDLFVALQENPQLTDLRPLLRALPAIPGTTAVMKQFRRFKSGHPHLALVVDAYGQSTGFVTMDLLLQTLVGRIQDEYRRSNDGWESQTDGSIEGPGWLSIHTLDDFLPTALESETVNSIGGLVVEHLGRFPKTGETVQFPEFSVTVLSINKRRIERVRVRRKA